MNKTECVAAENPFWKGLKPEYIERIVKGATEKLFSPGELIFREGEPANRMYLLQSGRVALQSRNKEGNLVHWETLGPGDVAGWAWLFPPFQWHAHARAIAPTRALACDGAALLVESEADDAFGHQLMKRIAQLVIHRLESTRHRLMELESRESEERFEVPGRTN